MLDGRGGVGGFGFFVGWWAVPLLQVLVFVLRGRLGLCWAGGTVWLQYRLWHCWPKAGDAVCPGGCIFMQVELQRWWSNRVPLAWVIVRGVAVDPLLSGPALVGQDGVCDGRVVAVLKRVSGLEQSSNVVRTVVASASMSRSGTTLSHVVRDVVSGGPVCPSSTSVSYLVQSCSMRSTYAASVYGWILCSARVRAWASCWYRPQCRGAGLGGGVAAGSGVGSFFSVPLCPCWVSCTRVYSSSSRSGVLSRSASPVDEVVGRHVAVHA